jgi:hypothetical protein
MNHEAVNEQPAGFPTDSAPVATKSDTKDGEHTDSQDKVGDHDVRTSAQNCSVQDDHQMETKTEGAACRPIWDEVCDRLKEDRRGNNGISIRMVLGLPTVSSIRISIGNVFIWCPEKARVLRSKATQRTANIFKQMTVVKHSIPV